MGTAVGEKLEDELSEMSIGQKLRKFRDSTGLNCAEFAEKIGVNRDVIMRLESDADELTVKMLIKIAEIFGVTRVGMFLCSRVNLQFCKL